MSKHVLNTRLVFMDFRNSIALPSLSRGPCKTIAKLARYILRIYELRPDPFKCCE